MHDVSSIYPLHLLSGALFLFFGIPLALGRVPPNHWYGFRTPKTLSHTRIWYPVNARTGRDMMIIGPIQALTATLLLPLASRPEGLGLYAGILSFLILVLITCLVLDSFLFLKKIS